MRKIADLKLKKINLLLKNYKAFRELSTQMEKRGKEKKSGSSSQVMLR